MIVSLEDLGNNAYEILVADWFVNKRFRRVVVLQPPYFNLFFYMHFVQNFDSLISRCCSGNATNKPPSIFTYEKNFFFKTQI